MLNAYRQGLLMNRPLKLHLNTFTITHRDLQITLNHFQPQYDAIIEYFTQCHRAHSMENGSDIEFATSFLSAYLYGLLADHVAYLHMVRVCDLCLDSRVVAAQSDFDEPLREGRRLNPELNQYISSSSYNIPSPVIASACISKLQQCLTLDARARAIVTAYITYIRPRITKSNDYLLLTGSALGLTADDVEARISTLVYRVTGKVAFHHCLSVYQVYLVH